MTDILIKHLIQQEIYVSPKLFEQISVGIAELFKSEINVYILFLNNCVYLRCYTHVIIYFEFLNYFKGNILSQCT